LDTEIPVAMGKFAELVWKVYTSNVKSNFTLESEHNMITDFYGWKCKYVRKPWISNCYYDLALKSLDYILGGNLSYSAWQFNASRFYSFEQD